MRIIFYILHAHTQTSVVFLKYLYVFKVIAGLTRGAHNKYNNNRVCILLFNLIFLYLYIYIYGDTSRGYFFSFLFRFDLHESAPKAFLEFVGLQQQQQTRRVVAFLFPAFVL